MSIGCVCARSKLQKGLDSYQEVDLGALREKWSEALDKRRRYLDEQLQKIMSKNDKGEVLRVRVRAGLGLVVSQRSVVCDMIILVQSS